MARGRPEPGAAAAPAKWSDLRKRVLSAAILAPVALACLWFAALPWTVLIALAAAGLGVEWVHLCGRRALSPPGIAVPAGLLLAGATAAVGTDWLAPIVLALAWLLALASARPDPQAARLAAGIPYIGLAAVALIWLRRGGDVGRANVLFVVLIVWASDVGAFLIGRWVGGPKLAPRISPAKTWAGAGGGLVGALAAGLVVARLGLVHLGAPAALWHTAVVAGGLGLMAQAGDLFESGIKRRFGVKDSSRLIPGHGGLLDRLDGMLAAAPVAALLVLLPPPGGLLWR